MSTCVDLRADDGNRTRVLGLEDRCITIMLHPRGVLLMFLLYHTYRRMSHRGCQILFLCSDRNASIPYGGFLPASDTAVWLPRDLNSALPVFSRSLHPAYTREPESVSQHTGTCCDTDGNNSRRPVVLRGRGAVMCSILSSGRRILQAGTSRCRLVALRKVQRR